jgi:hypothetical protein
MNFFYIIFKQMSSKDSYEDDELTLDDFIVVEEVLSSTDPDKEISLNSNQIVNDPESEVIQLSSTEDINATQHNTLDIEKQETLSEKIDEKCGISEPSTLIKESLNQEDNNILPESNSYVLEEFITAEVSEDQTQEEVVENQKQKEVVEDQKQEEVVEDQKQEEVVEDQKQEEVVEDQKQEEVVEDQKQEEVVEDQKQEEVFEDQKQEEVVEDQKQEEVFEDQKQEEVVENQKQEEVSEDQKQEEVSDETNILTNIRSYSKLFQEIYEREKECQPDKLWNIEQSIIELPKNPVICMTQVHFSYIILALITRSDSIIQLCSYKMDSRINQLTQEFPGRIRISSLSYDQLDTANQKFQMIFFGKCGSGHILLSYFQKAWKASGSRCIWIVEETNCPTVLKTLLDFLIHKDFVNEFSFPLRPADHWIGQAEK